MNIRIHQVIPGAVRTAATVLPFLFVVSSISFAQKTAEGEDTGDIVALSPFEVVSDGKAGYRPATTNVLTRTNRNIIDVPQTVDVLPEQFLKDTSARMMDEAFVYVANAQVRNTSGGTSPNQILIRGFNNASSFTDGIETGSYQRDMHGYERMEVVKGPASAVQGRGTESGYINFVLKKPVPGADFTRTSFSLSSGKNDKSGYRFTLDHNFDLAADKGIHARVAAVYDKHDSYIDFLEYETAAIYPSIRWVVSEKTDVVLMGEFMNIEAPARDPGHGFAWIPALYRKEIPVIGVPTDPITALNLPENFNIGGPQDGTEGSIASGTFILTHKFSDAIQFRQAASVFRSANDGVWWDAESNEPAPVANIPNAFKVHPDTAFDPNGVYIPVQQGFVNDTTYRTNIQGDLNIAYGNETIGFVTLLGYAYEERDSHSKPSTGTIPTQFTFINLKNPELAWAGRTLQPGTIRISRSLETFYKEFGYYLQQDVNLFRNRVLLSGGYRRDKGKDSNENYLTQVRSAVTETTVDSWRVAGTYKVRDNISLYGIFSTQKDPDRTGNVWGDLPPGDPRLLERFTRSPSTELTEFGVKGEFFNRRVTMTFSWYEIVTTGSTTNDRVDTTSQAPDTFGQPVFSALRTTVTNGAQADGLEFSINGRITDRWDLLLAYGTLDTTEPVTSTTSRPIRHSPEYDASVFTRYSFENEDGRGWSIRGGYSMIGPFVQQVGGSFGRIPMDDPQWRVDVGASYHFNPGHSVDLIVKNATNQPYIVTRTNPPRELRLTYNVEF